MTMLKQLFDAWDDAVNDVWQWRLVEDSEEEARAMEVVKELMPMVAAAIEVGDAALSFALAVETRIMTLARAGEYSTEYETAVTAEGTAWRNYVEARSKHGET